MKKQSGRIMTTVWLAAFALALSGGAARADSDDKIIAGESATVAGGTMSTWAHINGAGKVICIRRTHGSRTYIATRRPTSTSTSQHSGDAGVDDAVCAPVPLLPSVLADRLAVGYAQPEFSVPQMGRHARLLSEFTATDTWQLTTPSGFLPDARYMHFIEPMITREFLSQDSQAPSRIQPWSSFVKRRQG